MSYAPPEVKDHCAYSGSRDGGDVGLQLLLYPGKNSVTEFAAIEQSPPGPTVNVNGHLCIWLTGSGGDGPDGFLETIDGNYVLYLISQAPSGAEEIAEKALGAAERRIND
jgi:hypothetical protein